MALVVKDRVKQTTTTTGTGTLTLNGTVDGFQTFAAALSDGDTTYYALLEPSTNSWEVGLGTWTESTTALARTTILASSNAGSAVSLTAQSEVFITQPADKAVYYDANGDITPTGNVDVAGTLDVTGAATFDDSVTIQGDLTINGTTTTVSATNLAIEDNMIYLNDGSTTTNPDLGWAGNYNDGTYAHAGVFRDASDGTFKLYDGYTPEPGTAIDTTHASFTLAPLDTGALSVEGNLTVTGTVDGRDVASDGSKLDGIEAGATGDQSASEILTAVKTVDGSGSGLDADLLDGQQGSYYLDWTHVTNKPDPSVTLSGDVSGSATMTNLGSINITTVVANDSHTHDGRYYTETEVGNFFLGTTAITGYNKSNWDTAFGWGNHASANYLAASSYTAADVLTKIKTVDGSGSGLDADTVDGLNSAQFLRSDANDTYTGLLSFGSTASRIDGSDGFPLVQVNDSRAYFGSTSRAVTTLATNSSTGLKANVSGTDYTVWHAGNDGSGSGLDADLLDGQHGSYYYSPANAPDPTLTLSGDASGSATFTNLGNATLSVTVADDSHNHTHSDGSFKINGLLTGGIGASTTAGTTDWNHITNARSGQGNTLLVGSHTNGPSGSAYYHPFSFEYTSKDGTGNMTQFAIPYNGTDGPYWRYRYSNSWSSWYELWHSGNDGSGSGLDADLLDGLHETTFMRKSANSTLNMNNNAITNANNITFNDPGPNEGLEWTGGSGWKIYESPDDLTTNSGGNLQFVQGSTREMTLNTSGSLYTAAQGTLWGSSNDGSGSGLDADLLDGYQSSQSQSSNTVAVRNANGYLFSMYFNGSGTFSTTGDTSGMARFTGTNGTDTYGRSYTAQAAATLLSGSTMNISGTATNITQYTVNQSVGSGNSPSFAGLNINGNLNAVDSIYLANALYHEGDTNTSLSFGTDVISLTTGGTSRVYIDNAGVRIGDTGNGYFMPVTGDYGSIQIDGGAHGGWEGYSIGNRAVFMHDNASTMGLFDDVNNEWAIRYTFNGAAELYYNGATKLQTTSNGVNIDGNLSAVDHIHLAGNMYHEGDTDTYIGFHAADQWRVVTGGTERFEVNSTRTQADRLLVSSALAENYSALSGTTPTADPDNGGAFSLTMTGNTTFTFGAPALGSVSTGFILQLTGNGGTVTWPASVKWAGGTAPDAPASGETDILVFHTRDGGTNWYGVLSSDAAA